MRKNWKFGKHLEIWGKNWKFGKHFGEKIGNLEICRNDLEIWKGLEILRGGDVNLENKLEIWKKMEILKTFKS